MNNIPFNFLNEISYKKSRLLKRPIKMSLDIDFRYNDVVWLLFYSVNHSNKNNNDKYVVVTINGEQFQKFDSLDELYEKAVIDSKYLKDIWTDIELIAIWNNDPLEFYAKHKDFKDSRKDMN